MLGSEVPTGGLLRSFDYWEIHATRLRLEDLEDPKSSLEKI